MSESNSTISVKGISKIIYRARQAYWENKEKEENNFFNSLSDDLKLKMNKEISEIKRIQVTGISSCLIGVQTYNNQREEIIKKYKTVSYSNE